MISVLSLILLELLLLLQCLATLALLGACASEADLSFNCTNVPYPFGISGKALKGFEIICKDNSPYLQLNNHSYVIEDISLLQGYVAINGIVGFTICSRSSSAVSHLFDLEKTPYTMSTSLENPITMIGCDSMAIIQSIGTSSKWKSGCVSFCDSMDTVISGSCTGLGCCQASIPKGIKSFNLTLQKLVTLQGLGVDFNASTDYQCSQVVFGKQSNFTFSREKLRDLMDIKNLYPTRRIVLEWTIGNETCEKAKKNPTTYACKQNSYCHDSTDGVGYRCNCSQGYKGNPYIADGCKDIDECQIPDLNPCVGKCINELGTVSCACPRGQRGDGKKQGSGCRNMVSIELGLGLGLSLLFILITGGLWSYWFSKKKKLIQIKAKFFQQNGGLFLQQQILSQGSDATTKIFSIEELEKATNNFNESQILGRGGYGTVYKGILSNQKVVAIKKSKLVDGSQIEQFINEIVILSQINHRNVVKLLGCCLETQVPLLVYEFISNGTLFHLVQGENHNFSMPWKVRLRIATEIAGALAYLHSAASIPIIHRDVKSANILLDENYTAKVSDFGASRSIPFDQTHVTTLVQGTFGYLDPEYFHTSQLTEKSDVYSFGVVLAELLTSEIAVSFTRPDDHRSLCTYFRLMFDEQHLFELIEPNIVEEAGMEQLFFAAQLARRCLNLKGEERPTMKEIAMELDGLRRFQKQQLAPQNLKEMKHLIDGTVPTIGCIEEATRQYSLESDMLASMDLPR